MAASNASANLLDRELLFTRVFDAPRELVFDAWTDPRHLAQWWGPNGFRTTIQEMDVRPGGVWRLVMHGPDGTDYKNRIVFREVVKPERLVYDYDPEPGCEPVNHHVTVTFTPRGNRTELTMRMLFPSAAMRDQVVEKHHADEGGRQTLSRLAGHLVTMQGSWVGHELVLERVFNAPRELVFQAFTEPERLRRWWGPTGFTSPRCEVDLRPGGALRIDMRAPNGAVHPMTGVFHEIVLPERLVFSSSALNEHGEPMFEVRNTFTFEPEGSKTRFRLRAQVTMATADAARYLPGMEQGWSLSLDRLAQEVEQAR